MKTNESDQEDWTPERRALEELSAEWREELLRRPRLLPHDGVPRAWISDTEKRQKYVITCLERMGLPTAAERVRKYTAHQFCFCSGVKFVRRIILYFDPVNEIWDADAWRPGRTKESNPLEKQMGERGTRTDGQLSFQKMLMTLITIMLRLAQLDADGSVDEEQRDTKAGPCFEKTQMKAIGYARVSSEEQVTGSGIDRQKEFIQTYCERQGLELVRILADEGLSGFTGEHLSRGKLGMLLAEADSGMYSGSALVIEQMDRLGRLNQHTAREILDRIRKAGLELHITQENRVVRGEFELGAEITNLLRIDEARKYSEKLSERVTKGHRNRRKNAKDGECVTENLPPWLTGKNGEQLKVDEAKAKLVRLP